MSHKAATAAMLAFLRLYGRAKLVKAGTALTDANPDLQDNFTDALTDIVLLGRSLGLDMAYSLRCLADHTDPAAVAEDAIVTKLADYTLHLYGQREYLARRPLVVQREDLRQMPRAWHLLVPESRHYIQNDAPDVVIAAIRVLAVLSH